MPYQEHPLLNPSLPPPETKIWRYMDLTKLLGVLHSQSLRFTNLASLPDEWEGHFYLPSAEENNRQTPVESVEEGFEESFARVLQAGKMTRGLGRRTFYVNCWHMNSFESEAMWTAYLNNNEGIAIQSTLARLTKSLDGSEETVFIGRVNYSNEKRIYAPGGNILQNCLWKRKSFEHEQEVRAIYWRLPPDTPSPNGVNIKVGVETLIENIYLAPNCEGWIRPLIDSLLGKYGFHGSVRVSDLSMSPDWDV